MNQLPKYARQYFRYLHEKLLFLLMGGFCLIMFIIDQVPGKLSHYSMKLPWPTLALTLCCLCAFLGLFFFRYIQKHRIQFVLALSCLFCILLAMGTYKVGFDAALVITFWTSVAIVGCYFVNYRHVTTLMAVAYVSMGIVHLALPESAIPYPLWLYMLSTPLLFLGYFYIISHSIFTYRRLVESEATLFLKTKELDNILNSLSAMIAYKDENNVYISANDAMARFYGLSRDELVGKSLYELIPRAAAERYHQEDLEIIKKGKTIRNSLEKVRSPKDQREIWLKNNKIPFFDENGEIAGIVFSAEDVTEQVLAEKRLRESEERFRMIFENAPDGLGLIAIPSNNFIKVNRALADMIGYGEDEIIGKTPTDFCHKDDRYVSLPLFTKAVKNDESSYSAEQRFIHHNGKTIHVRTSYHIVKEERKPKYLICIIQDVTVQKESEMRLNRYARKLEESNQNLQEFAYAASHDLREPLRTVVSYIQLLQRYLDMENQPVEVNEFIGYIIGGSKRMERQINALLQYSRVGRTQLKKEKINLHEIMELVEAALYAQISESNAVITVEDLPEVVADSSQMVILIQNLVSNAIKYQGPDNQPVIRLTGERQDDQWVICVRDNGIGIEPEYLEKIFAVFRRLHTQDQYPGSGVGLSICRRIMQRHGGSIWVESEFGTGSTFYFSLPVQDYELPKTTVAFENTSHQLQS